jgi:hypothetical protein
MVFDASGFRIRFSLDFGLNLSRVSPWDLFFLLNPFPTALTVAAKIDPKGSI